MTRLRLIRALSGCCLLWASACGAGDQVLEGDDLPSTAGGSDAGKAPGATGALPSDGGGPTNPLPTASDGSVLMPGIPAAKDCDLNGVWIARQQTVNVALGLPQTANNWYFFALHQDGEAFEVVEHFDCGIEVLGTVHVQLMPSTVEALIPHNLQRGRRGTMAKTADGHCAFEIDRFWSVRGMSEATYAPKDRFTKDSPETLAMQQPLPTQSNPAGAEDWDGDGELGIAWYITGIASGTRHSIQRDFTEWFSDSEFQITPSLSWTEDLVVRSNIGSEEVVLSASNPTLAGSGTPDGTAKHRVTFRFLGRDRNTDAARKLLKAKPFDTCSAIRDALPAGEL